MKSEGVSNSLMTDDLRLQCDEDIMGECTVEVKDIHIQGLNTLLHCSTKLKINFLT